MLAKNLTIGTLVDVAHDPFFNSTGRDDGGPPIREVEAIKSNPPSDIVYITFTGKRTVTYPNDYPMTVIDND